MFDATYKNYVNEMVTLDVSPYINKKDVKQGLYIVAYQWINIFIWILSLFPFLSIFGDILNIMMG